VLPFQRKDLVNHAAQRAPLDELHRVVMYAPLTSDAKYGHDVSFDRHYVWKALCNARKASKLIRKER